MRNLLLFISLVVLAAGFFSLSFNPKEALAKDADVFITVVNYTPSDCPIPATWARYVDSITTCSLNTSSKDLSNYIFQVEGSTSLILNTFVSLKELLYFQSPCGQVQATQAQGIVSKIGTIVFQTNKMKIPNPCVF